MARKGETLIKHWTYALEAIIEIEGTATAKEIILHIFYADSNAAELKPIYAMEAI